MMSKKKALSEIVQAILEMGLLLVVRIESISPRMVKSFGG